MHKIENEPIEPIKFEQSPHNGNEVTFIDEVVEKLEYYKRYSRRFNYCDETHSYHYEIFNLRNKVLRVKKSGIVFTTIESLIHTIFDVNVKENSIMILSEDWANNKCPSDFDEKALMLLMKHIIGYSNICFVKNFKYHEEYDFLYYNNSDILDELVKQLH